ncbi:MAG: sigma-70 family RNA polymerase sigma factor [Kiritimatiellae bacterium]|nr:sigma-70 family RNA polymerase sigma factor [Kiritimatiellia bacterium]MDD5519634.1 sigma-70 family RNA polymerase sigma factor [Kiritimatiellia bacterium]
MSTSNEDMNAAKLAAFETIVSEYEGMLLRYVARIVQSHDAAQDIVQDTFIKLFQDWEDELRPSPEISSWLYRVAHNCAVDHLRKETRRNLLHNRHAEEHDEFVLPNRGDGFRLNEAAEKAAAALRKLSLREQQMVILKVYEEKSYREISEITGLSVGNVGYILHFAMKKLAEELKRTSVI